MTLMTFLICAVRPCGLGAAVRYIPSEDEDEDTEGPDFIHSNFGSDGLCI